MRRLLLILLGGLTAVLAGDAAWTTARQAAWVASAPVSRQTVDALDAAAAAVLAPAAWLLIGWLGVIAALAGVAAGPGRGSASAGRLLARLAPSVLRRAAAGLAGASLAAGAWAGPAFADPSPAPAPPTGVARGDQLRLGAASAADVLRQPGPGASRSAPSAGPKARPARGRRSPCGPATASGRSPPSPWPRPAPRPAPPRSPPPGPGGTPPTSPSSATTPG